jgi:hypothetical protein
MHEEMLNLETLSFLCHRKEGEGNKGVAIGVEEFVLELDPVQAKRVEEALEDIHHEKNEERDSSEHVVAKENTDEAVPICVRRRVGEGRKVLVSIMIR